MIRTLLACALLSVPALARAGEVVDPTAPRPASPAPAAPAASTGRDPVGAQLKELISQSSADFADTRDCFALEDALRREYDAKRAAIGAEFKGKIPLPFEDFFAQKTERIRRLHKTCFQKYESLGQTYERIYQQFRSVDLTVAANRRLKEDVDRKQKIFLQLQPAKAGKSSRSKGD